MNKGYYQRRGKVHLLRVDGTLFCGVDPGWINFKTDKAEEATCRKCLKFRESHLARVKGADG